MLKVMFVANQLSIPFRSLFGRHCCIAMKAHHRRATFGNSLHFTQVVLFTSKNRGYN